MLASYLVSEWVESMTMTTRQMVASSSAAQEMSTLLKNVLVLESKNSSN